MGAGGREGVGAELAQIPGVRGGERPAWVAERAGGLSPGIGIAE